MNSTRRYIEEDLRMNPLSILTGWRTVIAGLGLIGLGVYQLTEGQMEKGVESIGLGLAAIGIGGKLDKATAPGLR